MTLVFISIISYYPFFDRLVFKNSKVPIFLAIYKRTRTHNVTMKSTPTTQLALNKITSNYYPQSKYTFSVE